MMAKKLSLAPLVALIAVVWSMGAVSDASSAGKDGKAATSPRKRKAIYEQKQDVIYGQYAGVALVMDVFSPAGAKNGIGIIDIASGAWHSDRGKIDDHRRALFYDIFCGRGYTVFAIRPGSVTHFSVPEMIKNLRTGIRFVRERAGDYGIDPNNLGLTGASAGGHLACLLTVTTEADKKGLPPKSQLVSQPFKAVAVFFPPTDFLHWGEASVDVSKGDRLGRMVQGLVLSRADLGGKPLDKRAIVEKARSISPTLLVHSKQPPFLIIHGDADPLVPLQQSEIFVEALKKAGGSAELIVKKGGGHPWLTINQEVRVMADWFDKQFGKSSSDSKHAQTAK